MRVLLDTHAFLWWINQHERLSGAARDAIDSPHTETFVSVVNAWEIVIKAKVGRFRMPGDLVPFLREQIAENDFGVLPVELTHALAVYGLPDPPPGHKDPFDRLLLAQALSEDMALVSADKALDGYGVERIW